MLNKYNNSLRTLLGLLLGAAIIVGIISIPNPKVFDAQGHKLSNYSCTDNNFWTSSQVPCSYGRHFFEDGASWLAIYLIVSLIIFLLVYKNDLKNKQASISQK